MEPLDYEAKMLTTQLWRSIRDWLSYSWSKSLLCKWYNTVLSSWYVSLRSEETSVLGTPILISAVAGNSAVLLPTGEMSTNRRSSGTSLSHTSNYSAFCSMGCTWRQGMWRPLRADTWPSKQTATVMGLKVLQLLLLFTSLHHDYGFVLAFSNMFHATRETSCSGAVLATVVNMFSVLLYE
jgi:hypothetical protein